MRPTAEGVNHVERSRHEGRDRRGQRLHRPRHPALHPGARGLHRVAGGRWSRGDRPSDARHARLVILDFKMPRLDGFAACAQIRHLPGYADVPIAMLTAFDDEEARAAARRAGVTAFLAKPFKPVDLLRGIAILVGSAPADGGAVPEPVAIIWKRRQEPAAAVRRVGRIVRGSPGAEHLPPLKRIQTCQQSLRATAGSAVPPMSPSPRAASRP